jgi:MtN3 and saliva related transmembrane protein
MLFFFNLLQLYGGLILSIGYIPQIIQIFRNKEVENFNPQTFAMVFYGILCMESYALFQVFTLHSSSMFLITNSLSVLCSGLMLIQIISYKKIVGNRLLFVINTLIRTLLFTDILHMFKQTFTRKQKSPL